MKPKKRTIRAWGVVSKRGGGLFVGYEHKKRICCDCYESIWFHKDCAEGTFDEKSYKLVPITITLPKK